MSSAKTDVPTGGSVVDVVMIQMSWFSEASELHSMDVSVTLTEPYEGRF